ncbi:hypothetical protein [Lactobacillus crispatus]|jgi:hypothetical protein|uniref:Uncharacterized protein n=5 Tax=Lactobacillus crispatus TaxID=47770 RepID=K1MR29_9LACO|nr:hypothetical protein [Lactobacillus crispatus]DAO82345.1 MAG TPA: tail-collar fiber protein [Bacteriophage sp.]EEX29385.1 hypothetical protein HMPREF0508_01147 [Lactobacillus crispatus MV-3A-US]EKB64778.1 hypothetical protein HMPREF9249_01693 [Lactobacillus crispatus FB077-07]EKB68071.1 hypothetical protein HMPREF9250_00890 [Lactobacillus crispatus FB049-03]KWU10733.1 hypothetical protein AEL98_04595 [Lactobacillus crispatus]
MDKFKDTIITDAGRKLLINVGAGNGEIAYTRAVLAGQDVSSMADEDIRKLATLENQKMEVNVIVTPPQDNTITVSASFGNKDLTDDLTFSSVGWYAKNNNDNKEILLGVSPSNGEQTLAAGSPDHRSTASIDIDLAMAISNAAKVDLTVNEIGVAHMSDVNAAILKLKAEYDPKIEQAGKVKGAKINDGAVVEPDDDGILDLIVDSDRIKDFPADLKDLNDLPSGTYRTSQSAASFVNYPKMQDGTTPFNIPIVWKNALIKVVKDANAGYQLIVSSQQKYAIRYFSNNHWGYWFQLPTLSNNDIIKLIDSKVDGLNIGNYATKTDLTSVSNSAVKKVNGLTPDGSGNVNVTSTVARGFDANANATTKMTEENLHGGNQILMDQNAGQDIVNWAKGQFNTLNGNINKLNAKTEIPGVANANDLVGDASSISTYKLSNSGNLNVPDFYPDKRGTLININYDGNAKTQIWIPVGNSGGDSIALRYWEGNNYPKWKKLATVQDTTNLQNQINDLKKSNADLIGTVNWLKDNAAIARRFPASQEAQAQQWENDHPNYFALIEKIDRKKVKAC